MSNINFNMLCIQSIYIKRVNVQQFKLSSVDIIACFLLLAILPVALLLL